MTTNNRRPTNPIMRLADDAINYLDAKNLVIKVESVVDNMMKRASAQAVLSNLPMLFRPSARARLKQRGYLLTDEDTLERKEWLELTEDEYAAEVQVHDENLDWQKRHNKARHATQKFLAAKRQALGRPVTVGEFASEVEAIYERHGVSIA